MNEPGQFNDHRLELMIGNLLRVGVALAGIVVLLGGAFYLTQHGMDRPDYHAFHGPENGLNNIAGILRDAGSLHSRGMIQLGLLLLVLTPVARVALSAAGFLIERDWLYLAITLIVFTVLASSLAKIF